MRDEIDPAFMKANAQLRRRRCEDELIGICRGLVADGLVNQMEAEFLAAWFMQNPDIAAHPPYDQLKECLDRVLCDEELSEKNATCLLERMRNLLGPPPDHLDVVSMPSNLIFSSPESRVSVPGKTFCLSGVFNAGSKNFCKIAIQNKGGRVVADVTTALDYLVVGLRGSSDWIHTIYGTKIEKAMKFKLIIITEQTLFEALRSLDHP